MFHVVAVSLLFSMFSSIVHLPSSIFHPIVAFYSIPQVRAPDLRGRQAATLETVRVGLVEIEMQPRAESLTQQQEGV